MINIIADFNKLLLSVPIRIKALVGHPNTTGHKILSVKGKNEYEYRYRDDAYQIDGCSRFAR